MAYIRNVIRELFYVILHAMYFTFEAIFQCFVPAERKNISGHIAVVTGAGHGIGRCIALALARKGVRVVLWDINEQYLNESLDVIDREGWEAYAFKCDVTNNKEVYKVARKVRQEVGPVDILVNNAGVVTGKRFDDCSDEEIQRTYDVNTLSHFWTTRAFLGHMKEQNQGHIVGIASITGLMGTPGLVDYASSKSAVITMMEALRQEILSEGKDGVILTTVLPTKVDTGMFNGAQARFQDIPPTVQPEYIANKVVDAIQRDETYVILPRWLTPFFVFKHFLPQKVFDLLVGYFGLDRSMDGFMGHQEDIH